MHHAGLLRVTNAAGFSQPGVEHDWVFGIAADCSVVQRTTGEPVVITVHRLEAIGVGLAWSAWLRERGAQQAVGRYQRTDFSALDNRPTCRSALRTRTTSIIVGRGDPRPLIRGRKPL